MANAFDQFDAKPQANAFDQFDQQTAVETPIPTQSTTAADVGLAAVGGANTLAPSLLGMPMDVMQNIGNLGLAGYGAVRGKIGEALGETGYIPPEPFKPLIY